MKKRRLVILTLTIVGVAALGASRWQPPTDLPTLDEHAVEGLTITCHPSKAEYQVGDSVGLTCRIFNETDTIKPIGWNSTGGSHFILMRGEELSFAGQLPDAHPVIPKPLLIKSGQPPTTERVLYLPPRESLTFYLSVGKAERPTRFKGRVAYDPLATRSGWVTKETMRRAGLPVSDFFTYEVFEDEE